MGRSHSGNCGICGVWRHSLHRDHIQPKFLGGSDDPENIQHICANCHEDKTRNDLTGIPLSPAARIAQSKGQTGKKRSAQAKANIRAGVSAACQTEEFREKMRQTWMTRSRTYLVAPAQEQRFHCNQCDMTTHAGPMKRHQQASGHVGTRIEGTLF